MYTVEPVRCMTSTYLLIRILCLSLVVTPALSGDIDKEFNPVYEDGTDGNEHEDNQLASYPGFAELNATILEGVQKIVSQQLAISAQRQEQLIIETVQRVLAPLTANSHVNSCPTESKDQCLLDYLLGKVRCRPAQSCKEIKESSPLSPSGHYWINATSTGTPKLKYCDMTMTCGGIGDGWMEVMNMDMNLSPLTSTCPEGLVSMNEGGVKCCGTPSDSPGCVSTSFSVDVPYEKVCGRVIGYQHSNPNAFNIYFNRGFTLNSAYVDGVSLTHGQPRQHIWTFAAAYDESEDGERGHKSCPCSSQYSRGSFIPHYVGQDYFCDSGSTLNSGQGTFYDNPLWDGAGCGSESTCCSFNNPPWFMKQLDSRTENDIDLRLCRDRMRSNEDITIAVVELYVQ